MTFVDHDTVNDYDDSHRVAERPSQLPSSNAMGNLCKTNCLEQITNLGIPPGQHGEHCILIDRAALNLHRSQQLI